MIDSWLTRWFAAEDNSASFRAAVQDRKDYLDARCGVSEPWPNMRDDDADDEDIRESEFRARWEVLSDVGSE